MSFSIGVLLGVIFKRHRKPRLVQFREELKKSKKEVVTLYQYPAKGLFCIVCVVVFVAVMHWLSGQLQAELQERGTQVGLLPLSNNKEAIVSDDSNDGGYINLALNQEVEAAIRRTRMVFTAIYVCSIVTIIALVRGLTLKKVRTTKRGKTIETATFTNLGLQVKQDCHTIQQGERLEIWQMGESRFTNTNYYYSIRIITKQGSWEIIKKSNIYSSRTTLLQLAELHALPHSTKILKKDITQTEQ